MEERNSVVTDQGVEEFTEEEIQTEFANLYN